jgi:ribonuclease BN (tRNA processing enzyme)
LIDEYNIIDFSPDVFHQVLNCGISLKKLRNILLTHFHEDHFNIMEMAARMCAIPRLEDMVMVICSAPAAEQIAILFERFKDHNQENPFNYFQKYQFATVEPFQTYHFHNLEETPILSSHHSYGIGWNRGNGT